MIRLILIRHGRTEWNTDESQGRRFRGMIDLPLAGEGVVQAQATARHLADLPLSAIYSSPLQRAVRTAQIIAEPHGLAPHTLPGLRSMDYGHWAGRLDWDVAHCWPKDYGHWRQDPFNAQIPGGESTKDLRNRAIVAVRSALANHTDGESIALVSHQVVTKTLSCVLAGLPNTAYWQVRQDLCNLTRFDYNPTNGDYVLVGLNDTCHLNRALPIVQGGGTRVILVRHGQTAWNVGSGEERFRGRADLPLDATGQAQAHAVAIRLRREPLAALYASPLLRARATLAPLAAERSLPLQSHEGLLDINYGRFQGLTHSDAASAFPEISTQWRITPHEVCFPEGEGLANVQARLLTLMDELAAHHPGETVALVGHQIVNKVLVSTLLGLDLDHIWHIRQDTAGIDAFQRVDGVWRVLCINDTCHLPPNTEATAQ
jgi:probable phosphoglycerate mutase